MPASSRPRLLVTGATGGMGKATCVAAIAQGYDLLLADLDNEKLEALAQQCRDEGAAADWVTVDVTNEDHVAALVAKAQDGGLDGIVHTVGLSPTMASGERIIDVDLVGYLTALEALRPTLRAGACAVCISSMSAHMVPPNPQIEAALANPLAPDLLQRVAELPGTPLSDPNAAYPYAKKALIQYVEGHAMAWGREGKRLVTISPGLIDTPMGKQEEANDGGANYARMEPLISLQRHGQPEEIAGAAMFLLSPQASYVTGCDILVDGGFVGSLRQMQRQA